ncbi:MAG: hypothetical protein ABJP02_04825 [Parasphingorhabdus sp.]|uniref:hypothetical protein n=1 Tax=Parasphingorhabdus sp. TaxID=2709688 RepID=UPI0032979B3B
MTIGKIKAFGPVAWIFANWQIALAIAAALIVSHTAVYFVGRDHGGDSVRADQLEAERKKARIEKKSEGLAAEERGRDADNIQSGKERTDEDIRNSGATGQKPSAADDAVTCSRVRRTGQLDQFPGCRRREDGTGT